MQRPLLNVAGGFVALFAAGLLLWFAWPSPPPPTAAISAAATSPSEPAPPPARPPAVPDVTTGLLTRKFRPDEPHAALPEPGTAPPVGAQERRTYATPFEAEQFVEEKVVGLLVLLDATVDLGAVAHACTEDGRHCTFEGPWLGDQFLKNWVRAISNGTTSLDALGGVRFSGLRAETRPDGTKVFVLEAHAP
jgi:hypothetical protein